MAAAPFSLPFSVAFKANGTPAAGARLHFYQSGTLTPVDVFTTAAMDVAHPNPVTANGAGQFPPIYVDSARSYRVIVRDVLGGALEDIDPLPTSPAEGLATGLLKFAAGNGTANDAAAVQAAFSAHRSLFAPIGTYKLDADVTAPGNLSWRKHPDASFTGTGKILTPELPGVNHTADIGKIQLVEAAGTAAAPITHHQPVALFSKHINFADDATGKQPAAVVMQAYKWNAGADAHIQALFVEAIDKSGGATAFVEGLRAHGVAHQGASAYGVLGYAEISGSGKHAIAIEAETRRYDGVDNPNPNQYDGAVHQLDVAFLATFRGGKKAMAGFMFNPHSESQAHCGFLVGNSLKAQGVNRNLVTHSAFATIEAGVPHAFYARNATFSLMSGPNDLPIRMQATSGAELDVLRLLPDSTVAVGTESVAIRLPKPVIMTPGNSINPDVAGQLVIQTTSDTVLTFKYQGSDNVVRSAALTLA